MLGNILIVDDMLENLRLLSSLLTDHGYQVRPVSRGDRALSAAKAKPPDLILLDIMMPGIDGYAVCEQLKADTRTKNIPVIFLSALDEISNKLKGFEVGGVDYISKPFQAEEVLVRIETHLTLRTMQKRVETQNAQLEQTNIQLQQEIQERQQTENVLQQRNNELFLLNRIGSMFSSSLESDQVLETALREVQRLLDVVSTSFWLIDPETDELVCKQIIGPGSDKLIGMRLPPGQGITGWVAQHGESVIIPDILADERHHKTAGKHNDKAVRSMLSIPLHMKGTIIGVLNLVDPRVDHFNQDDLRFVEPIAASAAIAIENARLYTTAQQEITERKRAEAALLVAHNEVKEKNEQLQELNASKDKFFSILAQDLQTPITKLLELTQVTAENIELFSQDELKETAETLRGSLENLYELLKNLFTWSGIQRGTVAPHPQPIDLKDIIHRNMTLFIPFAEEKQVRLKSGTLTEKFTYADPDMVYAVVRNLISNALKFTFPGDNINISATQNEGFVEVSVSDTGVGISQEDLPKLFRVDVTYQTPGTAGEEGTGLGLILCKELVELNDGRISVESEVGKGTTFKFTLPTNAMHHE